MIAPEAGLSVTRQCALLGVTRSSFYYRSRPESARGTRASGAARPDLHRQSGLRQPPAAGGAVAGGGFSWPPTRPAADAQARAVGGPAEAEHQQAASRAPGLPVPSARQNDRSTEPKPALAKAGVWAADITYIPMRQGFLYLVAIIDWATRRVLSWRLSNTLTAGFCVAALSEALARFGKPGIFNTDQGAQFTSDEFTQMLRDHGIEISMDGRGRCHDNIFVERLWWTVKHEWVYLRPAADGIEQKRSLGEFFDWYNLRRPHQALGWRTPDEAYLGQSTAAISTGRLTPCRGGAMNLWTVGCADPRKLHSTPQQDRMNLISGKGETSSRLPAFSLFLPGSCPNNRDRRRKSSISHECSAGLTARWCCPTMAPR